MFAPARLNQFNLAFTNPHSLSLSLTTNYIPLTKQATQLSLHAAVNGMIEEGNNISQSVQAYNDHQQELTTELSSCASYNVTQILQQLADI
jgi:hypothetical protein